MTTTTSLAPLLPYSAHFLSVFFAVAYVGSLYVSSRARLLFVKDPVAPRDGNSERTRLAHERWRNDPDVIRARLLAVTLASIGCCGVVFGLVWHLLQADIKQFAKVWSLATSLLGMKFGCTLSPILPHLITPVLFLGPLYVTYLREDLPFQRCWTFQKSVVDVFFTWPGSRTFIFGPITEELVFRSCVLAVYQLSGASKNRMIFLTPLTFGVAHLHHAWDTYNRYGRTKAAAQRAIIGCLFQFAYTTLFGFHVAYLFLRTGCLMPPITAHIFCNSMGFPLINSDIREFPSHRRAIILAYIIGVLGFIYTLPRWSETDDSMFWQPSASSVQI